MANSADDARRAPAPRVALDQREHERGQADGDRARRRGCRRSAARSRRATRGSANSVTTTAPTATGRLRKKIDCQETFSTRKPPTHRADRQRQRADAGPRADRLAALGGREGVGDDREGAGHHERGADALDGAARDEPGLALREADERAGRGERDDAEEEHAPAPEEVAQAPAGDQQDGERQRVGVHGPLEAGDRRAEVLLDRRQRDVHDGVVEHHHEQREAHGGERPPAAVVLVESDAVGHAGSFGLCGRAASAAMSAARWSSERVAA